LDYWWQPDSDTSGSALIVQEASEANPQGSVFMPKYSINAKHVSLIVLVVQQVAVVLVIRFSRIRGSGDAYLASTAVLVTECFKLGINLLLESRLVRANKKKNTSLASKLVSREGLKLIVPAILYVVQNIAEYVALSNLTVPVYQITNQGKLLTTALFSRILLNKHFSPRQYLALAVLTVGVAVVQLSSIDHEKIVDPSKMEQQSQFIGLLAVLLTCATSGFAGVYLEMVLKSGSTVSLYMRNCQLALCSIPFAALSLLKDFDRIKEAGFFQGYDGLVFGVILSQAVYGLVISLAMKYADTILKGFASSISIALGALFTAFIWKVHLDGLFVIGAAMVLYSTWLYAQRLPTLSEKERKRSESLYRPVISGRQAIELGEEETLVELLV